MCYEAIYVFTSFLNKETCTYFSNQMQTNGSGQNEKFYPLSQRRDKNERCIIQFFSL